MGLGSWWYSTLQPRSRSDILPPGMESQSTWVVSVSRLVKVVKGGVAHTDVEPIGWPGEVGGLTCGTQVQLVLLVILHLLQHPELLG